MQDYPLVKWANEHPRLAAWVILALGMVILLVIEARDVGLLLPQWIALIVATVAVAGLCIWIISWEDEAENEETHEATVAKTDGDSSDDVGNQDDESLSTSSAEAAS